MKLTRRIRRAFRAWAYDSQSAVSRARQRRMLEMISLVKLPAGARILDLGGTEYLWNLVDHDYQITLLNLPRALRPKIESDRFDYVEADACDLQEHFATGSFDLVFSNSTIEHVGSEERQKTFAEEARRIGQGYWIQTPSSRALIEAHSWWPLYWQFRRLLGMELLWKGKTRVLTRLRMVQLFPDGKLYVERFLSFEKSYALYRPCHG
jgi:hypothetical protein